MSGSQSGVRGGRSSTGIDVSLCEFDTAFTVMCPEGTGGYWWLKWVNFHPYALEELEPFFSITSIMCTKVCWNDTL